MNFKIIVVSIAVMIAGIVWYAIFSSISIAGEFGPSLGNTLAMGGIGIFLVGFITFVYAIRGKEAPILM